MPDAYYSPTNSVALRIEQNCPSTSYPRRARLTKSMVESLSFRETGQLICWDTSVRGFGVRIGRNSKTYIAEGRVNGRTCRIKLGRADVLSAEGARSLAKEQLVLMSKGEHPKKAKQQQLA